MAMYGGEAAEEPVQRRSTVLISDVRRRVTFSHALAAAADLATADISDGEEQEDNATESRVSLPISKCTAPATTSPRRRADSSGLGEVILREGWVLKEAGSPSKEALRLNPLERLLLLRKNVLPRRRYCVLFPTRLSYFSEALVKIERSGPIRSRREPPPEHAELWCDDVYLNEFNTVVDLEADSDAAKALRVGDVLTEVDGESVVGRAIDWRTLLSGQVKRHLIKVMRMKGFVPLGAGVEVRTCKCLLNKVRADAAAFEIDLRRTQDEAYLYKDRYILICADEIERDEWLKAVEAQCPPRVLRGNTAQF